MKRISLFLFVFSLVAHWGLCGPALAQKPAGPPSTALPSASFPIHIFSETTIRPGSLDGIPVLNVRGHAGYSPDDRECFIYDADFLGLGDSWVHQESGFIGGPSEMFVRTSGRHDLRRCLAAMAASADSPEFLALALGEGKMDEHGTSLREMGFRIDEIRVTFSATGNLLQGVPQEPRRQPTVIRPRPVTNWSNPTTGQNLTEQQMRERLIAEGNPPAEAAQVAQANWMGFTAEQRARYGALLAQFEVSVTLGIDVGLAWPVEATVDGSVTVAAPLSAWIDAAAAGIDIHATMLAQLEQKLAPMAEEALDKARTMLKGFLAGLQGLLRAEANNNQNPWWARMMANWLLESFSNQIIMNQMIQLFSW